MVDFSEMKEFLFGSIKKPINPLSIEGVPNIPFLEGILSNDIDLTPETYEDSMLKDMAEDVSARIEKSLAPQISALESLANTAHHLAETADQHAESAKTIAASAEKTANKADVKGWLALAISVCSLIIEIIVHHREILSFLSSILQLFKIT